MPPEDRSAITTSIAALWTLQQAFMTELLRSLRDEGALSEAAIERLLQRLDELVDAIEGDDNQAFASELFANARAVLRATRPD